MVSLRKHYSIFLSRESALWYCEAICPNNPEAYIVTEVKMRDKTIRYIVEMTYDI